MTLPNDIKDLEKQKFVEDTDGNVSVRTNLVVRDIEIGAVELKNASDDTRAKVKTDGTDNALVVMQNSVPTTTVTATDLDIRDLTKATDSVKSEITGLNVSTGTYQEVNVIDTGTYNSLFVTPIDPSGVPVTVLDSGADALANNHNQQIDASWGYYYNGTTWDRARGDLTNGLLVNLGTNNAVTITSGSVTVSGWTTDTDDGAIAKDQVLPLVINENYIYSKTAGNWVRQEGTDTGYTFTRLSGIYTPNGDLAMDDTLDAVKISGPVTCTQTTSPWVISGAVTTSGTATVSGTVSVNDLGKYYGASGLNAYKEADGKPRFSSTPYGFDVAEGNITGHTTWSKIGYNSAMSTSEEDLWSGGGVYPALLTTGIQMSVKSTDNTNDKAGGNGALTVTIYYLKTDFTEATEVVTLVGTTWVDTVSTDIMRINGFSVTSAGSTGKATGAITLADKATRAIIYGNITLGYTRARNSNYTVPNGKTLYIRSFHAGFGANAANKMDYCRIYLRVEMNEGAKVTGIFYPYAEVIVGNTTTTVDMEFPIKVPQQTAIKVSGVASAAGEATCVCRGWLE